MLRTDGVKSWDRAGGRSKRFCMKASAAIQMKNHLCVVHSGNGGGSKR